LTGSRVTWIWYTISLVVLLLDQWTKALAQTHLTFGMSREVTGFFDLTLAYNRGAAFSFLSNSGGWQRWFFSVIALVVSVVLAVWIWRLGSRQRILALGLALILGGAIGNLYDRLALGHVVDFISVHYQSDYWPAFNIADSAITCGAILLIVDMLQQQRKHSGASDA
jgi:signal peptidase II